MTTHTDAYEMGEERVLFSVAWRLKGLLEHDKVISQDAFDRMYDFIVDIAPDKTKDRLRAIRTMDAEEARL